VTTILGPLLASNLFAYFTSVNASIYFPGAAFFMAGVLVVIGWFVVLRSVPKP
jgi:DHA1 family tetracycline resistance protein-like MFS transporter